MAQYKRPRSASSSDSKVECDEPSDRDLSLTLVYMVDKLLRHFKVEVSDDEDETLDMDDGNEEPSKKKAKKD